MSSTYHSLALQSLAASAACLSSLAASSLGPSSKHIFLITNVQPSSKPPLPSLSRNESNSATTSYSNPSHSPRTNTKYNTNSTVKNKGIHSSPSPWNTNTLIEATFHVSLIPDTRYLLLHSRLKHPGGAAISRAAQSVIATYGNGGASSLFFAGKLTSFGALCIKQANEKQLSVDWEEEGCPTSVVVDLINMCSAVVCEHYLTFRTEIGPANARKAAVWRYHSQSSLSQSSNPGEEIYSLLLHLSRSILQTKLPLSTAMQLSSLCVDAILLSLETESETTVVSQSNPSQPSPEHMFKRRSSISIVFQQNFINHSKLINGIVITTLPYIRHSSSIIHHPSSIIHLPSFSINKCRVLCIISDTQQIHDSITFNVINLLNYMTPLQWKSTEIDWSSLPPPLSVLRSFLAAVNATDDDAKKQQHSRLLFPTYHLKQQAMLCIKQTMLQCSYYLPSITYPHVILTTASMDSEVVTHLYNLKGVCAVYQGCSKSDIERIALLTQAKIVSSLYQNPVNTSLISSFPSICKVSQSSTLHVPSVPSPSPLPSLAPTPPSLAPPSTPGDVDSEGSDDRNICGICYQYEFQSFPSTYSTFLCPPCHPSSTHPSSTHPSSTHPSSTDPSSARPSSTHPPSTHPPSSHPPSTHPPSTHPPSTHPPSTHPPSTHPPSTTFITLLIHAPTTSQITHLQSSVKQSLQTLAQVCRNDGAILPGGGQLEASIAMILREKLWKWKLQVQSMAQSTSQSTRYTSIYNGMMIYIKTLEAYSRILSSAIQRQSTPQSTPQSAPQSAPQPTPQSAPQSTPQSAPQSAPIYDSYHTRDAIIITSCNIATFLLKIDTIMMSGVVKKEIEGDGGLSKGKDVMINESSQMMDDDSHHMNDPSSTIHHPSSTIHHPSSTPTDSQWESNDTGGYGGHRSSRASLSLTPSTHTSYHRQLQGRREVRFYSDGERQQRRLMEVLHSMT